MNLVKGLEPEYHSGRPIGTMSGMETAARSLDTIGARLIATRAALGLNQRQSAKFKSPEFTACGVQLT